jgi:hypothetical protein
MISNRFRSVIIIAAVAATCLVALPGASMAESIHGSVTNGTTGSTDVAVDISVINPAAGMAPLQTIRSSAGEWGVDNLAPGVYIARVEYQGVTYNQSFQIEGNEHVSVVLTIYETSPSWDGIRVVTPHFTATRHEHHLVVERVYDIYNETAPLNTVTGSFRFPLPSQMHDFNGMYIQYGDVPVEREPVETDEPGIYSVEYPIRPGLTRVVMSYAAEYENAAVTFSEKLQYDMESFTIFATDAEMKITSPSHDFVEEQGAHAGVSWKIDTLKGGEQLELAFQGGVSQEVSPPSSQASVTVIPNDAESLSTLLLVILLLALAAFSGIALREHDPAKADAETLAGHRDLLVSRLARLDDMHEAGAIPGAAYQIKRTEIKNQIASLIYRLNQGRKSGSKGGGGKKAGAR